MRKSICYVLRAIEFTKFLKALGFVQSKQDYSLFTRSQGSAFTGALVYVNDVLLTGNDQAGILFIKQQLDQAFTIKDLGLARYFLGVEIASSSSGTLLNQRKYIADHLTDAGLSACKPLPSKITC